MVNTTSIEYIEEVFRKDGRMDDYTPRRKAAMQERLAPVAGAWDLWYRSLARRTYVDYKFVVDPQAPERRPRYNVFSGKPGGAGPHPADPGPLRQPLVRRGPGDHCLPVGLVRAAAAAARKEDGHIRGRQGAFCGLAYLMGQLLQETQIQSRRSLSVLRLRYYSSMRKLYAAREREQMSAYKFRMLKDELGALQQNMQDLEQSLGV